eukprot:s1009_g3.t1
MDFGARGIGGEIKLFPAPLYHGELDKWDDWSWQQIVIHGLCEAYDVQQTQTQNNQLSLFAKQLAYMLAQITDGAARVIVRNEDTENGFEIWRRLFNQFSLPSRARATNLLNEIIAFRLRHDHLESDLSEFIILKNRPEKATGVPLDNDLLITLIMQKTTGPLQQHLRKKDNRKEIKAEWYGDEWDEYDWSQDWIGSLDDWSGDWAWSEDDWSYWSDDWSWGPQDWWSVEQRSVNAPSGSQSTATVPQDPKSEPTPNVAAVTVDTQDQNAARSSRTVRGAKPGLATNLFVPTPNVAAVTVDTQDQNAARSSRTVRGAKPGLATNLFVGAWLLIGALSAGVPPVPSLNVPDTDGLSCDDRMVEFHMQAGLVDKSWILFDSGACANCCRKIVQLDCGNGHSLSVQLYVCTGIPFPLVSVARLLLQDFWTVMAKDYLALIDSMGNPVPIVRQGTVVYLCPTAIPYAVADAARMAASCLPEVMDGIENELGSLELRGRWFD